MRSPRPIRDAFLALRAFLSGLFMHVAWTARKRETLEHCEVCQLLGRPIALGKYMIRTGQRADGNMEDASIAPSLFVCQKHHPDERVLGAELAHETQDVLKRLNVSAECVYFYKYHRQ